MHPPQQIPIDGGVLSSVPGNGGGTTTGGAPPAHPAPGAAPAPSASGTPPTSHTAFAAGKQWGGVGGGLGLGGPQNPSVPPQTPLNLPQTPPDPSAPFHPPDPNPPPPLLPPNPHFGLSIPPPSPPPIPSDTAAAPPAQPYGLRSHRGSPTCSGSEVRVGSEVNVWGCPTSPPHLLSPPL